MIIPLSNLPEIWMLLLTAGGMLCPELIFPPKNECSPQKKNFAYRKKLCVREHLNEKWLIILHTITLNIIFLLENQITYQSNYLSVELDDKLSIPWHLITIRGGTKGYIGFYARRRRVWIWQKGASQAREVWLVILKDAFTNEVKYFISNFSNFGPKVTLTKLVHKAARRYYIERAFQDAKTSLGMANYQVRVWKGWHHHMAMISMALLFMLKERILNESDVTLLSCQDIVELLNHYLPRADKTEEAIFKQLEKRHKKRQKSIESAYQKQAEQNPGLAGNLTK